ncbi:aldehyde dehydrogenase family protein [Paralimibaculum aggregatum]|uniref:aldehyde dehydrogenase (NAD(+)) n=1 Tax=Paralimibaculum aggregatum TaxID=3036245 RepID=A0ABQ6LSW1_9RHOB|nr:aldehyde dehydrogenase family protein [Limibaculum sp. NKW23]GMG85175.1 aldehyde dehydrogenase family protein [Limibaculum sp. NKW23]
MPSPFTDAFHAIHDRFFIDGAWVLPARAGTRDLVSASDETRLTTISMGSEVDVDRAVAAAGKALPGWSGRPLAERIGLLERLLAIYTERYEELARTISLEMGAPIDLARNAQARTGLTHLKSFIDLLGRFDFAEEIGTEAAPETVLHEPIGICGIITPWNWPMNQMMAKVVPALGVGCTVVMKPSEMAPLSAMLVAEMIREAGFPAGVFNLVNGDGVGVGEPICRHEDVAMISFTGSTGAGVAVSRTAAATVKRVVLELGGKSPNIIFADTDLEAVVRTGAAACFRNSGQSCNAPTRMLVERGAYDAAVGIAAEEARRTAVDLPEKPGDHIGPLVSRAQYDRVQALIETGIAEGARLVAGGTGKPPGFERGHFARATVFADVESTMAIAQEEIFGPVLAIQPFDTEEDAVRIANDTRYGLNAQVQSADRARALRVARRLDCGMVQINGAKRGPMAPFGGYKHSGNGRESGIWGLREFLEIKAVSG